MRWLLALFGDTVIPFEFAGLQAGRDTRGLRFEVPEILHIRNPGEYFIKLGEQGIILEPEQRQQTIQEQVESLAVEVEGEVTPDPALLEEVTNLVEAPVALRGSFEPSYLDLPREVLISVMKKHQRYFPVESAGGLLPYFITVRNGDHKGMDLVREGNEHVIRARFADAAFFIREDVQRPLSAYLEKLGTLTFQKKLGSMLDKSRRVTRLVDILSPRLGLEPEELQTALRAAELSKADLATQMVVEMTSLQGTMGRYYARLSGEPQAVAEAIFEHYLPRYSGDQTTQTRPGLAVGLADRLDTLVGLFAAGMAPSGNKDPFALRRAALGLALNLIAWDLDLDLAAGVDAAASLQPIPISAEQKQSVLDFIKERLRNIFLEQGYRYDVVDAVLAEQGHSPARAMHGIRELSDWVTSPEWASILPAYARCVRITRDLTERYPVDPELLVEPAEQALYQGLARAEEDIFPLTPASSTAETQYSVDAFLGAFVPLIPAINRFFEEVLVMDENERLRRNRLGLLQRIAALARGKADLSKLEGF